MEEERIDQSAVATTISEGIEYTFKEDFLVKPLDLAKVKKEFSVPVVKGEPTEKDGIEANDYDEVTTEVKEVDSDYREAIVIKVPYTYNKWMNDSEMNTCPIHVGDKIVFRNGAGRYFDLFKDSMLVKHYDIIAVING